jgi:hypothetical protein
MAFESLFSILIALMVGAGYPLQAGINASIAFVVTGMIMIQWQR